MFETSFCDDQVKKQHFMHITMVLELSQIISYKNLDIMMYYCGPKYLYGVGWEVPWNI